MAEEEIPENLDISDELIAERRGGDLSQLPDDMPGWMRKTIIFIDLSSQWAGRIFCWMLVPLMFAMVYEVVARKLFVAPTYWAYDVSRMLCGAMFMFGAAYALMRGVHIRADFIYRNWSPKTQGALDCTLYVIFFFPAMIFFFLVSFEYAFSAWASWERSMDTAWMAPLAPARTAMPVGALLLIIQGISEFLKSFYAAKNNRWP